MITQIQDAAMKSSAVYSDEYLKICLLFMKYPFVYDFDWFRKAVRLVEEEYCTKVPNHPQNQNFVFSILVDTRFAVMNNRFKRVMLRQVGIGMIKSNPKQKLFLEKMHYFGGKRRVCL